MLPLFHIAVSAFIIQDNKLLLLKRRDDDPFLPGYWEVPGGKLEENESIEQAVIRETKEEAGIDVATGNVFGYFEYENKSRKKMINLNFICRTLSNAPANVDSGEMAQVEWVTEADLLNYKISEAMYASCIAAFLQSHH